MHQEDYMPNEQTENNQEDHAPNEQAEEKQENHAPNEQPEKEQSSTTNNRYENLWKGTIVAAILTATLFGLAFVACQLADKQWRAARIQNENETARIQEETLQAEARITHEDYLDLLQRVSWLEGKVWRLEIEIAQLKAASKSTPTLPEKAIPSPDFEGEAYIIPIGGHIQ